MIGGERGGKGSWGMTQGDQGTWGNLEMVNGMTKIGGHEGQKGDAKG